VQSLLLGKEEEVRPEKRKKEGFKKMTWGITAKAKVQVTDFAKKGGPNRLLD